MERGLMALLAGALPATLFLDWFEVADQGRFTGWESFNRTDLVLVALCLGLMACAAVPRWRGASLVRILFAGAAVAVIARELANPPAGTVATTVLFGGKAAVVIACGLLALALLAARQRFGRVRRAEAWALLLFPSALL